MHRGLDLELKNCNEKLEEKTKYTSDIENNLIAVRKELSQVRTLWKDIVVGSTEQIAALQKQLDALVQKLSNSRQIALQKQLDDLAQELNNSTQTECKAVDLVFLLDGSFTVSSTEFTLIKKFVWDIITRYNNSAIQFAAAQFSHKIQTIFTFKDYKESTAKEKLDEEEQMEKLSNTYRAIHHALVNLFNYGRSGADPESKKVLVIITDGVPTDYDAYGVLKQCDDQGIFRIIVGVSILSSRLVTRLASDPKDENSFLIGSYRNLDGLLDKLQTKISSGLTGVC
ncbi:integrin alpha-L-like isoform X2 [Hoplias malabaricus]|uniref:integrin alpha-L-like isoform X2 n=1 Tax=Hoplias malabaricus TaxID=27720 RepID=UPI0034636327